MEFNTFSPDSVSYEQFKNQPRRTSTDEVFSSAFELSFPDTGVGLLSRYYARKELEERGGKVLTPEDANAQYPGMDVPFREPIKATVARYLYDRHQEKSQLEQKIANGPNTFMAKSAAFGAGIISHLMDPAENFANYMLGMGIGSLMNRGAFGARVAGAGRVAKEATESFAGNLVGNSIQEGFIANQAESDNEHYDPAEGIKNVIYGTIAGTALHVGIKEGVHQIKSAARNWNSLSPEMSTHVMKQAVGDIGSEVRANPELIMETVARETDVNPEKFPGKFSYNYEPLKSAEGKVFYHPTTDVGGGSGLHTGDNVFGGTQVTDNPAVANVAATRSFSQSDGVVWDTSLKDIRSLQLNEFAPDNLKDTFVQALEKAGAKDATELVENFHVKDLFDYLKTATDDGDLSPELFSALRDQIKEKGYNALLHNGSMRAGIEHSPHNVVELLDDSLMEKRGYFNPDRAIRNEPSLDQLDRARSHSTDPDNRTDFDNKRVVEMESEMANDPYSAKDFDSTIEKTLQAQEEELTALKDQGLLTENELLGFRNEKAEIEFNHKVAKAAAFCVGA